MKLMKNSKILIKLLGLFFIDRFPTYFTKYLTDNNIEWNLLRRNGDRIKNREVYILI